jgi:FkbM family methyltransferase
LAVHPIVKKESAGTAFLVVDPTSYPYGDNTFEDEADIKQEYWTGMSPGDVVLDVGAAWGGYTLPALAQGAHVIAFDSTEDSERVLHENVTLNGLEFCRLFSFSRLALWDLTPYPEWMTREIFGERYPVADIQFTTLDAAINSVTVRRYSRDLVRVVEDYARGIGSGYSVEKIDRVKIDVEGAELGVLRGGEATLRRHHPFLLIEDHAGIYPNVSRETSTLPILKLLEDFGYEDVKERWWGDPIGGRNFIVARYRRK